MWAIGGIGFCADRSRKGGRSVKGVSANALAIWGKSVLSVLLGFFSSRWMLVVLGMDGYGLWVLMCGLLALTGFLHGVLASATGRYLAVAAGRGTVAEWYVASAKIHLALAFATVVLGLPICLLALNHVLSVPDEYRADVFWAMACIFVGTFIGMANAPRRQLFTAYQRMVEPAIWNCLPSICNFVLLAWMVMHPGKWFLVYVGLSSLVTVVIELILFLRSRRTFGLRLDWGTPSGCQIREILSFAGWRILSDGGYILSTQGLTMLINRFMGPVLTASAGIARTVSNHCCGLSESVAQAYEPALANAVGARQDVRALTFRASFRLVGAYLLLSIPLALFLEPLLRLWLVDVPPQTASAVRWLLAVGAVDACMRSFYSAVVATGQVKALFVGVGVMHGLTFPLAIIVWLVAPGWGLGGVFACAFLTHLISLGWSIWMFERVTYTDADRREAQELGAA